MELTDMKSDIKQLCLMEGRILQALSHPNITAFKEVYKSKHQKLCIVMEYCDGGGLNDYIKLCKKA
jgi:serine/threonine protein kinase